MRFHWLTRGEDDSTEYLRLLSSELDRCHYHSMLLVYHSKMPDNIVKAARVMSGKEKIKYMFAIRTYAISPEYMAMICKSLNQIAPNKIMLNVVSGDIHSDETSIQDLVYNKDVLTPELRLDYTDQWVEKFLSIDILRSFPEIVMAGHSEKTRLMAKKYNSTHVSMLDSHLEYIKKNDIVVNEKQMATTVIVVRETEEEADIFFNKFIKDDPCNGYMICGTKEQVKNKIKSLEELGITDILTSKHIEDDQVNLTNETIKEIMEEQNGIK